MKQVDLPLVDYASCLKQLKTTRLGNNFLLDPISFTCAGGETAKGSTDFFYFIDYVNNFKNFRQTLVPEMEAHLWLVLSVVVGTFRVLLLGELVI